MSSPSPYPLSPYVCLFFFPGFVARSLEWVVGLPPSCGRALFLNPFLCVSTHAWKFLKKTPYFTVSLVLPSRNPLSFPCLPICPCSRNPEARMIFSFYTFCPARLFSVWLFDFPSFFMVRTNAETFFFNFPPNLVFLSKTCSVPVALAAPLHPTRGDHFDFVCGFPHCFEKAALPFPQDLC